MIFLNLFSAASSELAAHLKAIPPSCQLVTRLVMRRAPEYGFSMMLVEERQRQSHLLTPNLLTVKVSANPSRKLAAALGHSLSSHWASFSSFCMPSFASSL